MAESIASIILILLAVGYWLCNKELEKQDEHIHQLDMRVRALEHFIRNHIQK